MNPFLEPTLATPLSGASWRRLPGRLRRARSTLRAMTLAGSLLVPAGAFAVDLNAATPEQLLEVKGIGPKTARIIIEERERGGRFSSITDLSERVKGIGPKKAAAMQASGLTVGDAGAPPPPVAAAGGRASGGSAPTRKR